MRSLILLLILIADYQASQADSKTQIRDSRITQAETAGCPYWNW